MSTSRKTRAKKVKYEESPRSSSSFNELDEEVRKSRIRDSNKEYARRMTILQTWCNFWEDYTTREGDAYPPLKAKEIIKKTKKITCPIESCGKSFTSFGGLKYHYARCNIERCYKCKLCDPNTELTTKGELLKHMILKHYQDAQLPSLDSDQKEIANSFLTGEHRVDKNKIRSITDIEPATNPSRLINAYCELVTRVYKSPYYEQRPFKYWRSDLSDWEFISHEFDRSRFYPPEYESVRFRLKQQVNSSTMWNSIKTGESIPLKFNKDGEATCSIFYTGGVNTAAAWAPKNPNDSSKEELVAIAIDCNSMDQNRPYKQCHRGEACIQFWNMDKNAHPREQSFNLSYILAHQYGTIFDMMWCPLGTSWELRSTSEEGNTISGRVGLLALACGDGQIRIISAPSTGDLRTKATTRISETTIEATPIYRARPVATLVNPGIGPSTDYQSTACRTLSWSLEENQRYIAAGYTNGTIALFDLQNTSPIIYSNMAGCHIHQPLKSCIAHGAPVTGIAISTGERTSEQQGSLDRVYIASGSTDRILRIWNVIYDHCLINERAPITKILWDYRFRGIITATDAAFTSYNNRVSYKYPLTEGHQNITISTHRSIVWSLGNSLITNAIATSDGAGEVFVMPQTFNRLSHKRDRSLLNIYSLYSMVPHILELGNQTETEKSNTAVMRFSAQLAASGGSEDPINGLEPDESLTMIEMMMDDNNENTNELNEENDTTTNLESEAEGFSGLERPVANKPEKFLLPKDHQPVETYSRFKSKFGLEFIDYNQNICKKLNMKIPESCERAGNLKNIYCDRPCDYPFSSINNVVWSPNLNTFPFLLSTSHIGLCRLDRVQAVEQIYKHLVDDIQEKKKV